MAVEAFGSAPRAKVAPWNDPVIRGWVFQIVVVGLVGALAWYLVTNTIDNLARQKIATGFHYLEREAGLRDRRHDDRLLAGQHLCPRHLGRPPQHAEGGRARHHPGDHPRHADRRRAAVAQLAARQDLRMVRRGLPQRAAAALAVPVLQADQRGLPRAAPGDQHVLGLAVPQQPRPLFPGAAGRPDPQMDGHRPAGRHRRRVGVAPLGKEAPGSDRPALPLDLGGLRRGARPALPGLAGWAARRIT